MATRTESPAQAQDDYADKMVDLLVNLIQSGTITGTVTTTGTAATQTGPITKGKIV